MKKSNIDEQTTIKVKGRSVIIKAENKAEARFRADSILYFTNELPGKPLLNHVKKHPGRKPSAHSAPSGPSEQPAEPVRAEPVPAAPAPAARRKSPTPRRSSGRTGRHDAILAVIREAPNGLSRAEILERLGCKGDKREEMATSNALTALTKSNAAHRHEGRYHAGAPASMSGAAGPA